MKLINASYEILTKTDNMNKLWLIELAGRTCYKSENKITNESAEKFVSMLLKRGHESVIEHESITVKFIVDRGVSHELVRHRLAFFSQESTRYCNYSKDKFNNEVTFIKPCWFNKASTYTQAFWLDSIGSTEKSYQVLIEEGWTPQEARSVLPNALKTEIVVTSNLRHWREIFRQRTSQAAHPQMREVMIPLLEDFRAQIPIVFDSI